MSIFSKLKIVFEVFYGYYEVIYVLWEKEGIKVLFCFIVVCNNILMLKFVFDYILGFYCENEDGLSELENGWLKFFRNFDDYGNLLFRLNMLFIDSE